MEFILLYYRSCSKDANALIGCAYFTANTGVKKLRTESESYPSALITPVSHSERQSKRKTYGVVRNFTSNLILSGIYRKFVTK